MWGIYAMAPVKLVMTWNIQDDQERACVEFMVSELGPGLQRMGLRLTDAWYTQAGAGPQIVVAGLLDTAADARTLLASADFSRLRGRLQAFVENFQLRVVGAGGRGPQL